MFCEKCGTEVPDGSGFCRKCGNLLAATQLAKKGRVRTPFVVAALLTVACLLFVIILGFVRSDHQFTEVDVARSQADIKSQYESKGYTVEQVNMIKESNRRLTGYIEIKKSTGLLRPEFTKNCIATMDVDSGGSIWECK